MLGLLVVVLDLRVQGFDVLVDGVGWIVVVGALGELRHAVPGTGAARLVAVLAAVLSVADLLHPTRTVVEDPLGDGSMTTSTTAVLDPVGLQGALATAYEALCVVFLVQVCLLLAAAAARAQEHRTARHLQTVAVVTAVVQGAAVVVGVIALDPSAATAAATPGGVWLVLLLAVGGFLTAAWVLVSLWRLRTWPLLTFPSDTAVRA